MKDSSDANKLFRHRPEFFLPLESGWNNNIALDWAEGRKTANFQLVNTDEGK